MTIHFHPYKAHLKFYSTVNKSVGRLNICLYNIFKVATRYNCSWYDIVD